MSAFTIVKADREVEDTKKKVSASLNALLTGFLNERNVLFFGDSVYSLGWGDMLRLLVEGLDGCPLAYRNLILNSVYQINHECPIAVPTYIIALQKLLHTPFYNEIIEKINTSFLQSRKVTYRVSSCKAIEIWKKTLNDDSLDPYFESVVKAIYHAGSLGTVGINRAELLPYTSVVDGVTIAADTHPLFASQVEKNITLNDCGVIMVDGAILEISEIHHILTKAYENKKPLAIIATQIHDEIANTLAVNWKQGKLRVVPICLHSGLEDLNQTKDVSEIIGCTAITKDTGQRLSNIEFSEIIDTQSISLLPEKQEVRVSLYPSRMPVVIAQRRKIQEQIKKEKTQDIIDVMRKRLARLNCRAVELGIACTKDEEGILRDRIGGLLAFMASSAAQGLTPTKNIYNTLGIKASHQKSLPSALPAMIVDSALRRAISDFKTINKIKAIIALDVE